MTMEEKRTRELCKFYNGYNVNEAFDKVVPRDEPDLIYHYTGSTAFEAIISNRQLRFTNRHYLNDASEGKYVLQLCLDNIDIICPEEIFSKENFKESCEEARDNMENKFFKIYQCSFSLKKDHLPMWNYYGKGGVCLSFDRALLKTTLEDKLMLPKENNHVMSSGKVIYDVDTQLRILEIIIRDFGEKFPEKNERKELDLLVRKIIAAGAFFKDSHFEIEQEYRITFDLATDNGIFSAFMNDRKIYKQEFFNRNGCLVPCVDIGFNPTCLRKIMLPQTNKTAKNGITEMLKADFTHIEEIEISDIPLRF